MFRFHCGFYSSKQMPDDKDMARHMSNQQIRRQTRGTPQRSLSGPILFIIYINDLEKQCNNGSLQADDAKLFSYVECEEDSFRLRDIYSVIQWMEMWLLRLNTTKCKAMTYGRGTAICTSYSISSDAVEKIESIKDLGVTFDNK